MMTILVRTTLTLAFLGLALTAHAQSCQPEDRCIPEPIPEPASIVLVGSGLAGTVLYLRRRR